MPHLWLKISDCNDQFLWVHPSADPGLNLLQLTTGATPPCCVCRMYCSNDSKCCFKPLFECCTLMAQTEQVCALPSYCSDQNTLAQTVLESKLQRMRKTRKSFNTVCIKSLRDNQMVSLLKIFKQWIITCGAVAPSRVLGRPGFLWQHGIFNTSQLRNLSSYCDVTLHVWLHLWNEQICQVWLESAR